MPEQDSQTAEKPVKRPVLHLIDNLDCGGAQELLVLLAGTAPKAEYPTSVAVIQPATGIADRLTDAGIRVHQLGRERPSIFTPVRFFSYAAGSIRDIMRICREEKTSILHCHLSDAEFLGIMAGRLAGVDCILDTVHTPLVLPTRLACDPRTALRKLFTRWMLNMADWVIAVSGETRQALGNLGVDPWRLRVVPNGIDTKAFERPVRLVLRDQLGLSPVNRVLLVSARLDEPKGHRYLLDAIPAIIRRYPDVRLLLAGDGPLRGQLREQAEHLGIANHVIFLGMRSDIADILALADVFVLPSLWEGTSLALLEAMAAGRPIVTTSIPGNTAFLQDGVDCLMAPPGQPTPLAAKIIRLLSDPGLGASLGARARAKARAHFDVEATYAAYEHLWRTHPEFQDEEG